MNFLSLFVLILYISNNLLIKSLPRCTFEFFNDMTATEIAAEFGITRQAVHDMIRRCDKILADYEARLHLVAKFLTAKEKIKEIHTLSRRLLKEDKEQMEEDIRQIESVCNQVLEDL